jgi:4-alpha-glucanotransferase
MNTPGTIEGNWAWRMQWAQLSDDKLQSFRQLVEESDRVHA